MWHQLPMLLHAGNNKLETQIALTMLISSTPWNLLRSSSGTMKLLTDREMAQVN